MTKRQKEVLDLVAQGLTSKEIGDKLFISYRTVERHRTDLFKRFGVKSRIELIRKAIYTT